MAGTFKITKYEKSVALESKDLDTLATILCGYGFYDCEGTPKAVIRKYLELGALWRSYDINKSASYLKSKFPNIIKIRSLRYNPYKRSDRPKKNDFVAIDLGTDYANYKEIIYTVKNLLGWFTSSITLRETVKKGFIPRIFNNFDGTFECDGLNGVSRYDGENGFDNYLADHSVSAFSIIIEAKF